MSVKVYYACEDGKSGGVLAETLLEGMKFLYFIFADTWEEAMSIYYLRNGWEPYSPEGFPKECPNKCGFFYYPNGSGECPKCGLI
jgi:hypothetical protein